MKAFFIDPFNRKVTEIDYNGDYREISKMLACDIFTCATFNKKQDTFYVDDEGLFKANRMFFEHHGYPSPLCGFGLVLGTTPSGDSCEPTVTLEELERDLKWYSEFTVGLSGAVY